MIYSKNKYNTLGIVMNSFCLLIFIFFTYLYKSVYTHNILIKFIANSQGKIKLKEYLPILELNRFLWFLSFSVHTHCSLIFITEYFLKTAVAIEVYKILFLS